MKQINFVFLLLFLFNLASAQMYVQDPQSWWWESAAHIENVDYEVRPAGIYSEVSVSFDLFAEPEAFPTEPGLQLEFVWDFEMDYNVVFNDSWLYIDDYISYGEIYEANEGTAIFEAIVDRRQDPSILSKTYNGQYNFRVYPLFPDSTRRVKLSYLIPMDFSERNPEVELGFSGLMQDAANVPENVTVTVYDGLDWFHKPIEDIVSEMGINSVSYKIEDTGILSNWKLEFQADDPQVDVYFGTYEDNGEEFYQMIYYPDLEVERPVTNNLLVMDYDAENSSIDKVNFIDEARENLKLLHDSDNFAVVYSDLFLNVSSDGWQAATEENIDQVMDIIQAANIDGRTNLDGLLPRALQYMEENQENGIIHVVTANTYYYNEQRAKAFLEPLIDFVNDMSVEFEFRIADYAEYNRFNRWIDNVFYSGSEYFLRSLVDEVGGEYRGYVLGENLDESLTRMLDPDFVVFDEIDLDLDPDDGLTYANYFKNGDTELRLDRPVVATGKFVGEYPFTLDFKAIHNMEFINQSTVIAEPNLMLNNMAVSAWHAEFLLDNEFDNNSEIKAEVIETSIEERLLSHRTVFLCLEADTTAISSANDLDEEIFVSTSDLDATEAGIVAYPNPFINEINLSLPIRLSGQALLLEFTDMQGQLLNKRSYDSLETNSDFKYSFDGMADLPSGIYLLRVILGNKIYNLKVMHVKG